MAILPSKADMARERREEELRKKEIKDSYVEKYGETLGEALANYLLSEPGDTDRQRYLASVIALTLQDCDLVSRISAIQAILEVVDQRCLDMEDKESEPHW